MIVRLESSIVRIRTAGDRIVGAGFLMSARQVLTCAHVVAGVLGLPDSTQEMPQALVHLDFPLIEPECTIAARVIIWQPESDVAGLELNSSVPAGAEPVRLVTAKDLWLHAFRTFGFPAGYEDGVWASGVLRGRTAAGWVQIEDVKETGYWIQPGFSGAPVWDEQLNGVVGMAVAADTRRETKAAFMVPAGLLIEAWPQLRERSLDVGSLEYLQAQLYFLPENYRPLAKKSFRSFDDLIAERTKDFVGREFVDAKLAAFLESHDRGYFVLEGEPGIGKTAWAAHVVAERRCLRHFNVLALDIVRPDQCLENLCVQIIARYQLEVAYLPPNAGRDGGYLDNLLHQASERLDGQKLVIVVDAVDEVQMPSEGSGANILYLPSSLPAGVYFVLTRRLQPVLLETAPGIPLETFTLQADTPENQADLRAYLRWQAEKPEIAARLDERGIPPAHFIEELVERSEGNFMYLAYLLPDIAAGEYDPLALGRLPWGLRGYYERFWAELKEAKGEKREEREDWIKLYKPVIGLLAAAGEPVSAEWMGRVLGLDAEEVEDFALARWRKFLYRMPSDGEVLWRFYHASFQDFLSEQLHGARQYHARIAEYYRQRYEGNWRTCDEGYPYRHLTAHLGAAGEREVLYQLAEDPDWYAASRAYDPSRHSYALDVERAIGEAEKGGLAGLPRVVAYSLLYATLGTLATNVPPTTLGVMARLGEERWALRHAALIADPWLQADAYLGIGCVLGELGKEQMARDALANALVAAKWIRDDGDEATMLSEVAQAMARVGDRSGLDQTLAAAEELEEESWKAEALGAVAQALAQVEDRSGLDRVLAIAERIERPEYKAEVLSKVARALGHAGQHEQARHVLGRAETIAEWIEGEKDNAWALSEVAQALAQVGDKAGLACALAVAEEIKDEWIKAIALNKVAQALAQAGQHEQARQVLDRVEAVTEGIEDEWKKDETLSRVAQTMAQVGEHEQDRQMLDRALSVAEGIKHSWDKAEALSKVARALAQVGDRAGLVRTLAAAEGIEDEGWKASALHKLVQALAQVREFERAQAVAEGIEDEGYKAWALGLVAQALAQVGQFERAMTIAGGIEVEWCKSWALADVAQALDQVGEKEQAREMLAQALAAAEGICDESKAWALSGVAQALAEAGEPDRALDAVEGVERPEDKAEALGVVVWALAQRGDFERALAVTEEIERPEDKAEALDEVAWALVQAGEFERALAVTKETGRAEDKAWVLGQVACAQAQAGDFERALALTEEIGDERYKPWALGEVSQALAQVGDKAGLVRALAVAEEIKNEWIKAIALSRVAQALAHVGEQEQARQVLHQAVAFAEREKQEWPRAEVLSKVAQTVYQAGEHEWAQHLLDRALAVAEGIEDEDYKACALCDVAQGLACIGEVKQARQALVQALAAAERIEYEFRKVEMLSEVAQAVAQIGEQEQGRQVLARVLVAAEETEYERDKVNVLSEVAQALDQVGEEEQAREVLDRALAATKRIQDEEDKAKALSKVAQALAQVGKFWRACAAAEKIRDDEVKAETLRRVAQALAQVAEPADVTLCQKVFHLARSQGRDSAWQHIGAFALVLAALGGNIIIETWQRIQAVERLVGSTTS